MILNKKTATHHNPNLINTKKINTENQNHNVMNLNPTSTNKLIIKSEINSPKHEDKINNFINKNAASPTRPVKVSVNISKANQSSINSKDHTSNYLMFNKSSSNMAKIANLKQNSIRNNDSQSQTLNESKKIISTRKTTSANQNPKVVSNLNNTKLKKNSILKLSKSGSKEKIDRVTTENSQTKFDASGLGPGTTTSKGNGTTLGSNNMLSSTTSNFNQIQMLMMGKSKNLISKNSVENKDKDKLENFISNNNNAKTNNITSTNSNNINQTNQISPINQESLNFNSQLSSQINQLSLNLNSQFSSQIKNDLLQKQPKLNNYLVEKKLASPKKETHSNPSASTNTNSINKYVLPKTKAVSLSTKKNQTFSEIKTSSSNAKLIMDNKSTINTKKIIGFKLISAKSGVTSAGNNTNSQNSHTNSQIQNYIPNVQSENSQSNTNNNSHLNINFNSNSNTNANNLQSTFINLNPNNNNSNKENSKSNSNNPMENLAYSHNSKNNIIVSSFDNTNNTNTNNILNNNLIDNTTHSNQNSNHFNNLNNVDAHILNCYIPNCNGQHPHNPSSSSNTATANNNNSSNNTNNLNSGSSTVFSSNYQINLLQKKQLLLLNSANKNKEIGNIGTRNKKETNLTLHSGGMSTSKVLSEKSTMGLNTNLSNESKIVLIAKDTKHKNNYNKSSLNPKFNKANSKVNYSSNSKDKKELISHKQPVKLGSKDTSIEHSVNNGTKSGFYNNKKIDVSHMTVTNTNLNHTNLTNNNHSTILSKTKSEVDNNPANLNKQNVVQNNKNLLSSNRNTNNTNTNTNASLNIPNSINSNQNSIHIPEMKNGHIFNPEVLLEKFSDQISPFEREELKSFPGEIFYIGFLSRKLTSYNSKDLEDMNIKEKEQHEKTDNENDTDSPTRKNKIESNDSRILNLVNMRNRGVCEDKNYGYDDESGNYISQIGDHINFRYEVLSELGKGSFGQALKCLDHKTKETICIKLIKNKKKFVEQAKIEIGILEYIKEKDPEGDSNIVKILDHFEFRNHICIVFELLETNLYELLKSFDFQGLDLSVIRKIAIQLLYTLNFLNEEKIIHCDLKPENILLRKNGKTGIKVIDFGSSCFEHERLYSYIQSRFYRAPEVILQLGYNTTIDMWSFGCIIAELFTGIPVFPGENERDQIFIMAEYLGLPDRHLIEKSKKKENFFDEDFNLLQISNSRGKIRQPKTKDFRKFLKGSDDGYIDLILKCFEWDSEKRITPEEALNHPWVIVGLPKELISNKKKEEDTKKEATKISKPVDINLTQKSNYVNFKVNLLKNTKNSKYINLTAENKLNSKFVNAYKM